MAPAVAAGGPPRRVQRCGRTLTQGQSPPGASLMRELEPGHRLPAAPPPPPARRQARNKLKPPAAFPLPASRTQLRHPAPLWSVTSTQTTPSPARTATVTIPPAAPDGLCRTLLPKSSHQQNSDIPARVTRAEHPAHECPGEPCPLRPSGKRHALPNRQPSHHRTPPFPAAPPRETGRAAGGHREMHAQLGRERQAGHTASADPVRGSSVVADPVRGRPRKADGPSHRSLDPIPVRYLSVDPATQRPTALQGDTSRDRGGYLFRCVRSDSW